MMQNGPAMKIVQCLLLLLAGRATACDEHDPNCGSDPTGPIVLRNKCKYRVKDQLIKVIHPGVYETNVGPSCDFNDYPAMFAEHCRLCSNNHKPCNNSHAACGGCDCGNEDLHPSIKKDLESMPIKIHHTCDEMKHYFKRPNYNVVACAEGEDDVGAGSDAISAELVEDDPHYNDSVLESGLIYGDCTTHPHQIRCRQVPFILKFECDDCTNKGSPKMLTQCCERCKSFVDSLANNTKIPGTVLPLAFCSGCDSKYITFEDSRRPDWAPMYWGDHTRFEQYTEKLALQKQDQFLEDNICTALTPHCSSGDYKADECHAGTACQEKYRRLEEVNASLESCNTSDLDEYLDSLKNRSTTPTTTSEPSPASEPNTTSEPGPFLRLSNTTLEPEDFTADGCVVLQPSILAVSIVASAFVF